MVERSRSRRRADGVCRNAGRLGRAGRA